MIKSTGKDSFHVQSIATELDRVSHMMTSLKANLFAMPITQSIIIELLSLSLVTKVLETYTPKKDIVFTISFNYDDSSYQIDASDNSVLKGVVFNTTKR